MLDLIFESIKTNVLALKYDNVEFFTFMHIINSGSTVINIFSRNHTLTSRAGIYFQNFFEFPIVFMKKVFIKIEC